MNGTSSTRRDDVHDVYSDLCGRRHSHSERRRIAKNLTVNAEWGHNPLSTNGHLPYVQNVCTYSSTCIEDTVLKYVPKRFIELRVERSLSTIG